MADNETTSRDMATPDYLRCPEDRIKQAILHPERSVRDAAIRYFYSSPNLDDTFMPLAIEAIERHGRTGAFTHNHYLNVLPQTELTLRWVIAELHRDEEDNAGWSYMYFYNLTLLLCRVDLLLAFPHAPEFLHAPRFHAKEKQAFRERIEMFAWDQEACWHALIEFCETNRDKRYIEDINLGHANRIIEALARNPQELKGEILNVLTDADVGRIQGGINWLDGLMAYAAGEVRFQEAIPYLVRQLGHPGNFLSDQSLFSLIKIGTDEAVEAVCARFPNSSHDFRLHAVDLLGKVHSDLSVHRALEFLPDETDSLVRLFLCQSLVDHVSPAGIEPARQFIKHANLTPDVREFRQHLVAACKIMETRFPEWDDWNREAAKDEEATDNTLNKIYQMARETDGDLRAFVQKIQLEQAQEIARPSTPSPTKRPRQTQPGIRSEPRGPSRGAPAPTPRGKLGRNDPCRCGSGKKFKNCCLNKQGFF